MAPRDLRTFLVSSAIILALALPALIVELPRMDGIVDHLAIPGVVAIALLTGHSTMRQLRLARAASERARLSPPPVVWRPAYSLKNLGIFLVSYLGAQLVLSPLGHLLFSDLLRLGLWRVMLMDGGLMAGSIQLAISLVCVHGDLFTTLPFPSPRTSDANTP